MRIIGGQPHQVLPAGVPSHIVVPAWFGAPSEDISLPESSVLITDFGESFQPSVEARRYSNTPKTLRPPEARFLAEQQHDSLSYPTDIWTLACSIWTVLGQRPLFDIFCFTEDDVTKEQVDTLGKLPEAWWERWEGRSAHFDEDGVSLDHHHQGEEPLTLVERFERFIQIPRQERGLEVVGDEEKVALLAMLRSMLALDRDKRASAAELVACDWMTRWALPDLDKVET